MLRIVDKNNKLRFTLSDEDEEPLSVDELVLNDDSSPDEEENTDAPA